jgi:hypothetical protein
VDDLYLLEEYVFELLNDLLYERKKVTSRTLPKAYAKGTKASNASMAREINKCSKPNPPKSCYDYWDADKKYDKAKKRKKK